MWAAGHTDDAPVPEGLATVELLLEAGAPVAPADNRGKTALMIAAERNHPEIVTRLLAAGADPAVRDKEGRPRPTSPPRPPYARARRRRLAARGARQSVAR